MDNYRYFEYDISKYKGYRLIIEKSNMKYFKKIEHNGLVLISSAGQNVLRFKIEKQLIRRLKLKNLSDSIKNHSIESKVLELIERSEEFDPNEPDNNAWFSYRSGSGGYSYYDQEYQEIIQEEKNRIKYINKHQQRQYNNKIRQYENKGRFR